MNYSSITFTCGIFLLLGVLLLPAAPVDGFSTKNNILIPSTRSRVTTTRPTRPIGDKGSSLPTTLQSVRVSTKESRVAPAVPTTLQDAVGVFFTSGDCGPTFVALAIAFFTTWRILLSSIGFGDLLVFGLTVLFWSIQEHFLHQKVLHSPMNWIGKEIHQTHHAKPYYHVSLDPAPLLVGWMLAAHCFFQVILFPSSLPLALTATIAYSCAGLFYEWAHFFVHTKVRMPSKFWKRLQENHMRHHLVSDQYWYAFSLPWMDDWFLTNPDVRQIQKAEKQRRLLQQKGQ